jgi:hypothetical protein
MNQVFLVLITALVTGVVSVTGIWFGSNLTRHNEDWKWRRDHALEAYSDYLQAVGTVRFEIGRIYYAADCRSDDHAKLRDLILEKVADVDRISQRLFLLAPLDVNAKIYALAEHMGEVAKQSAKCPKIDENEIKAAMTKSAELQVAFMNAARNDLDVNPPLQNMDSWSKIIASEKPWWKFGL